MSALEDAAGFAQDYTIQGPLTAAIVAAANDIFAEDPATEFHDIKLPFATGVAQNPTKLVQTFAWAMSANPDLVALWKTGDVETLFAAFPAAVTGIIATIAATGVIIS